MCTTGVLRFADGTYALFKNKDFGRTHLDDRIWLDHNVFGVLGMTTWANDDPANDQYSGFSIGANRHGLLCCDSNVVTLDGLVNYDVMTQVALQQGTDVLSAAEAVRVACESAPTSWGNLVLIDATSAASLEIRGSEVAIVSLLGPTARSNHHVILGHHEMQADNVTSDLRLASAQRRIEAATAMSDIFELQVSHDDGGTGVCNHTDLTTVYSYALVCDRGRTAIHVVQGQPCSGAERVRIDIPLDEHHDQTAVDEFLQTYPTAMKNNFANVFQPQ
ncbi:MAG: hypothetical protein ABI894_03190 [Ilumatobacteraceae bacterium]